MQVDLADQLAEVDGILRHDHAILVEASAEHLRVFLAQAPQVARMDGLELATLVDAAREQRRQAFVDEELQAARAQGRPPGRPTSGWVRA